MPPEIKLNKNDNSTLSYYNGAQSETLGSCELKLTNLANGQEYQQKFQVVPKGTASLIGVVAAEELELLTIRHENIYSTGAKAFRRCGLDRSQFLEKYPQVFNRELGCLKGDLHLELDPLVLPTQCSVRRVPVAIREPLKEELTRLESGDVIAPVTEPTDWVSPIVIVHSPNGRL